VVSNLNIGYGRSFGRFLPMFDSKVTEETKKWNRQLYPQAILVEDCDASFSNVNDHPPLLPYEIRMPEGRQHFPKNRQISVNRLVVVKNQDRQQLELREEKTLKLVYIFDLGFQAYTGRSELFIFLNFFMPIGFPIFPVKLRQYLRWPQRRGITCYPRVYYGSNLVLWRQAWSIKRAALPMVNKNEPDADYFMRVNRWRCELKLPERVFVRLTNEDEMEKLSVKEKKKLLPDDRKPQYIDFANPFLVRLFGKMLARVNRRLWIEEMLPDKNQLLKFDGKPYVSEFIFQWKE
jgi:lantibiotic biosynthesis protein